MTKIQHSERIQVLDSFRALAIVAVIGFHILYLGERAQNTVVLDLGTPWSSLLSYGWAGVEFFFIISGFVIFMTLEACGSASQFLWRRFIRLWPAYAVSVLIIFCGMHVLDYEPFKRTWYDLVAAQALWSPALGANYISGVYWSLVVECRFYLLAAFVWFIVGGGRQFRLVWIALSIVATIAAFTSKTAALHVFSSAYLPLFTLGMFFYRSWSRRTDAIDWTMLFVALGSLVLIWSGAAALPDLKTGPMTIALFLSFCVAFWQFVAGNLAFLAAKPLLFLGRISYSLYLVHHELMLGIIYRLTKDAGPGVPMPAAVLISLAVIVLLATLMTFLIEEPAKGLLRRFMFAVPGPAGEAVVRIRL